MTQKLVPQVQTIADLLSIGADRFGATPALIGSSGIITYSELAEQAAQMAAVLGNHLPRSGASRRVAIHVVSKTSLCQAFYAAAAYGWSAMVCSEELPAEQLHGLLARYGPGGLILDEGSLSRVAGVIAAYDGPVFLMDASGRLAILKQSCRITRETFADDPTVPDSEALVLLTSGTTGQKKAVPISHRNLLETGFMINRFMGLDKPIKELVTVPLSHAFGLRRVFCIHLVGGAIVVEDGPFNPARMLQLLRDEPCTGLSAVPAVITLLKGAFGPMLRDLGPGVEFIELGSAPLSAQGKIELCEIFPKAQLCMHYGLTEASKVTFLHLFRDTHKLHTIGKPSPGVEVKLADEAGQDVPRGGVGEIWARGYNVAIGYLQDDRMTDERFVDGWFRTGDLAKADAEGYLEIVGRADDMINIGGKKLYPLEIEEWLQDAFPDIDCAVGAEASEHLGAKPVLYYSQATPVSPALFRDMTTRLALCVEPYKIPVRAVALPAIPRTGNGKILRQDLARLGQPVRA